MPCQNSFFFFFLEESEAQYIEQTYDCFARKRQRAWQFGL